MGFDPLLGMSRWAGLLFDGVVRGQQTAALSGGAGFTGEREGEDCLGLLDVSRGGTEG